MKTKTIYVVTEGSYSDYHIEGVFTDVKKALAYAELKGGEVEVYELKDNNVETVSSDIPAFEFTVLFFEDNGSNRYYRIIESSKVGYINDFIHCKVEGFNKLILTEVRDAAYIQRRVWEYHVYLKEYDVKLFKKIVQDEFARWKAEREGI